MYIKSTLIFSIILLLELANSQGNKESSWVLVADPLQNHTWWMKRMPMKGQQTVWQMKEVNQTKIIKIKLFQNESSVKFVQIYAEIQSSADLQIDSQQEFDPLSEGSTQKYEKFDVDNYQGQGEVIFSFFEGNRLLKQWNSGSKKLEFIFNNGKLTLTGQDFYFSLKLNEKYEVSYTVLMILLAILILKTQITFEYRGRFTGPPCLIPGILIYFLSFSKGIVLSVQDLTFNSPWHYAIYTAYSLSFYIWLPYAVSIYKLLYKATLFRWRDNPWKTTLMSAFGTFISVYGLFWMTNEISVLLIFAIEVALPKVPGDKDDHLIVKIIYVLQIFVVLYLLFYPIYPVKNIFMLRSWSIAVICMLVLQAFNYFFKKEKEIPMKMGGTASQKKKKKDQKKE